MHSRQERICGGDADGLLLLFGFDSDGLQIFRFENLAAVEALNVVHAVSTGEDDCIFMLAGGLHNQHLR
jgi:hypothetical protein